MGQAEQLKFNEFLTEQTKGYSNPSEAKANMREYYERALAGESGSVDSRYAAYLQGKMNQLEQTPDSYQALGQFAAKTGTMVEFMEGINKSSNTPIPRYQGWTDNSGPMPSGAGGGVTSVGVGSKLVSPSQRLVFTGTSKGTVVSETSKGTVVSEISMFPQKTGVNWFGGKEKPNPMQKALLSRGNVPSEYIFGGKTVSSEDYNKRVKDFERQRSSFENKLGVFNIQREFYEKAPTEEGYNFLQSQYMPLASEERALNANVISLNGIGAGLTFQNLGLKVIPSTETQTRFNVNPEDRERVRREIAERTSLSTGIESSNERIKSGMFNVPFVKLAYEKGQYETARSEAEKNQPLGLNTLAALGRGVTGSILKAPVEFPQMLGQIGQYQIFGVKGTPEEKQIEKAKIERVPSQIATYAVSNPVGFGVDVGVMATSMFLTGKVLSIPASWAGRGIGRVSTALKPPNVIQKTSVMFTGAKDLGGGARLVTGKIRSSGFADLALGKTTPIEAGAEFKSIVKPQASTIYSPALPQAEGGLSLVKSPIKQYSEMQLKNLLKPQAPEVNFIPKAEVVEPIVQSPFTTRQPFLQNVRSTSGVSGAVKAGKAPATKFTGVSAQMEAVIKPTVTTWTDVSPLKSQVNMFRAKTSLGGKFAESVGTTQMKGGNTFISRGWTKSVVEQPNVNELLFGKSEVKGVQGIFKPRANVIEQINVDYTGMNKKMLAVPKTNEVYFSQLAEQPKPSKPFSFEQPKTLVELTRPRLEKPEIRAVYENKPGGNGLVELTQKQKMRVREELTGELEVQRTALGGEATRLNVAEYQKAGARFGWVAGELSQARVIPRSSTTPLISKTGLTAATTRLLTQQYFPQTKTIPGISTVTRITPVIRLTDLQRAGQVERVGTPGLMQTTTSTETTETTGFPTFTPPPALGKWTFGLPLGLPQLGGGSRKRRWSFGGSLPSSIYKPSVIASAFKIRAKLPKNLRLTGLEIRPIPK